MLFVLVEEVAHREVVQLQSHTTDNTRLTPSERELYLVVTLLCKVVVDVYGTILVVRLDIWIHLLRVEVSHRSQLTHRTHDSILREEVAWLGTKLSTNHILVQTGVTVDTNMTQISLWTFSNSHFQVDRVAIDIHLCRIDVREHITIVVIKVANSIFILIESLVQQLLIIHIALLHTEQCRQIVGRVYGVAHPCHVAEEILLTLIHLQIDVHMLSIVIADTVFQNLGITIAMLIILVDKFLLVFLPAFGSKLLGFEEAAQLASLMSLGKGTFREESTLYLTVAQFLVTLDGNLVNLCFLLLIHHYVEDDMILFCHILALVDLDIGILKAFIVEIFLGQNLSTVYHVRSQLSTFHHTQLLLHILTLALLQTDIVDIGDTWTYRQIDVQIEFITHNRVGSHSHLREQAMLPIAFYRIGNIITRHFYLLAYRQARDTGEYIVFISLDTRHIDASYGQCTRSTGIRDVWVYYLVLCLHLHSYSQAIQEDENLSYLIH